MKTLKKALLVSSSMLLAGVVSADAPGYHSTGLDTIVRMNTWGKRADIVLQNSAHECNGNTTKKVYSLRYEKDGSDKFYSALLAVQLSGGKAQLRYHCSGDEGVVITGVKTYNP